MIRIFVSIAFFLMCAHCGISPEELVRQRDECLKLGLVPHEMVNVIDFKTVRVECHLQ